MKKKFTPLFLIFLFSVLLWVYVSFSGEYTINLKLPIEIKNIPEGYAVSSYSAEFVSLSLKGRGWQLAQHTVGRNPKFYVYCKGNKKHQSVSIRNEIENNPWISSTLQIVETSPQIFEFTIEEIKSKRVEIIPVISMVFKPGYGLVSDIEVEPDSVVIIGPESRVEQVDLVKTELKIFENLDRSVEEILKLEKIDFVKFNVDECKVKFDVQKIVDKNFDNVIVETKNVPPSQKLVLTPGRIKVVLRGGIKILTQIKDEDIKAFVEFKQALRDTLGAIQPTVIVPEKTVLIDVKPPRLDYIIKKY